MVITKRQRIYVPYRNLQNNNAGEEERHLFLYFRLELEGKEKHTFRQIGIIRIEVFQTQNKSISQNNQRGKILIINSQKMFFFLQFNSSYIDLYIFLFNCNIARLVYRSYETDLLNEEITMVNNIVMKGEYNL